MRITIDYDDTLSKPHIQELAKKLVKNHEVYILTARWDCLYRKMHTNLKTNDDIFKTAEEVGIQQRNVIFTNQAMKLEHIIRGRVGIHIDDNKGEIDLINSSSDCKTFSSLDPEIEQDVLEYLKEI